MSTTPENLNQIIAKNLRNYRKSQHLTLDEVSEATGVSKSMLGQIEREECGPSVATLWKICTGLKLSFTSLMVEEREPVTIVDNTATTPLTNDSVGFRLHPVMPTEPDRNFEILYIEIEEGAISASQPHEKGTEEFIMVSSGVLEITIGSAVYQVSAGQTIRYNANQPHIYANPKGDLVQMYMVIYYNGKA